MTFHKLFFICTSISTISVFIFPSLIFAVYEDPVEELYRNAIYHAEASHNWAYRVPAAEKDLREYQRKKASANQRQIMANQEQIKKSLRGQQVALDAQQEQARMALEKEPTAAANRYWIGIYGSLENAWKVKERKEEEQRQLALARHLQFEKEQQQRVDAQLRARERVRVVEEQAQQEKAERARLEQVRERSLLVDHIRQNDISYVQNYILAYFGKRPSIVERLEVIDLAARHGSDQMAIELVRTDEFLLTYSDAQNCTALRYAIDKHLLRAANALFENGMNYSER